MTEPLRCCHDTYTRDDHGVWRYPWGDAVPGAHDLTLGFARGLGVPAVGLADSTAVGGDGAGPRDRRLGGTPHRTPGVSVAAVPVTDDGDPDLVIGMLAPELCADLMLTVADIGTAAGVTKATVDSYRYRGYLPQPQVVRARTPLWARPIVAHWLDGRPGCGWRTDVYGARREAVRRMPVTGNRHR